MSGAGKKRSSGASKKSSRRRTKIDVHDDPVILPSLAAPTIQAPLSVPIAVPDTVVQTASSAVSVPTRAPDTRVLQTHSQIAQPSAEQLRVLLGEPIQSQQPTLFAQQQSFARADLTDVDGNMPNDTPLRRGDERVRDSIDNKLRQSKTSAFTPVPPQSRSAEKVQSRARTDLTDDDATTDSFATDSMLREIDAAGGSVVSRIDQLITNANNRSAARTINSNVRHGTGIAGVLGEKGQQRVQSIDEFVERVLNLSSMVTVSQELKDNPYVLRGLSVTEANPEWSSLQAERSAVEERRKELILQRQRMVQDRMTQSRSAIVDRARRRESVRQRIMQYEPIDAVQLLKPASEARRLTDLWRNLLGQTLIDIYNDHKNITTKSYEDARGNLPQGEPIAENPDSITLLYMQRVVNPVLNNYVVQLQTATYEDMPLTQEVLNTYLTEFLDAVLNTLLEEATTQGADAVERTLAEQEDAALRAPPAAVQWEERAAQLLQKFDRPYNEEPIAYTGMSPEERERVLINSYLRQALYIYATPIYEEWFVRWRNTAGVSRINSAGIRNGAVLLASLQRAVKNIVTSRAEAEQRRRAATLNNVPSYEAPNNATIVAQFRQLIVAQIALARCDALLAQANQSLWETALASALVAVAPIDLNTVLDIELLVRPRIDRYEILELARKQREDVIDRAYADIDENDLEAVARRETERESLEERARAIVQLLVLWSPIKQTDIRRHAPNDAPESADPVWQPFNVLYPLTIDAVQRQQPALEEKVRLFADIFDADAAHERAGELRSILSFGYAEQLIDRELMRIDYALRNFAQPTISVPLSTAVTVESQTPIHLTVQLELRPELELILQAPSDAMRDPDIVALNAALFSAPIQVQWWFRPVLNALGIRSATEAPRVLKEETLAANSKRTSSLQIDGPGTARAGYYWAEMTIGRTPYRSLFTAEVRVLCRCVRDNVVYEVGTETFGQCKWAEFARTKELSDFVTEVTALVEKGSAAVEQLIRRREYNLNQSNAAEPLYLPPWGTDDEESLFVAFQRIGNSNDEFTYGSILKHILHRLATQMRSGDIKVSHDVSDLALVVLLTDSTITDDDPATFVLQNYNIERSQNDDFAAPEARNTDSARPTIFYGEDDGARIRAARFFRNIKLDATAAFDIDERLLQAIPNEAIPVLRYYSRTSSAPDCIPLATMLYLLHAPLVYANLTWRERRFISGLRRDFDAQLFVWRQTLEKHLRQAASVEDQAWWRASDGPLVGPQALEREIWRRMTALTPTQAAMLNSESVEISPLTDQHTLASNILFDRAMRAEFDLLVDDHLVRHGLVVTHAATKHNPITGWLYTSIEKTVARFASSNSTAGNAYHTILERPQWIGAHSCSSAQPDAYDVVIDNLPTAGSGGAAVLKRGSIPTHKGYDFEGLDAVIQGLVQRHTTLLSSVFAAAADGDLTTAPDYPQLRKTRGLLRDLVFAYNYLAFCSTPLPFRETLSAQEIVELVAASDANNFFTRLRQQHRQAGGIGRADVLVY